MTWTRTAAGTGVVTILALLLVVALAAPVAATSERHKIRIGPGSARFEGRDIDLKRGWGDARACVVWRQDGETDCFRTEQAADAAVHRREGLERRHAAAAAVTMAWVPDRRATGPGIVLAASCGNWLTLYEHSGFGGRSLRFRDRGYYQDLADWGFAAQTSSYRIGSCSASLRDSGWTAYPGSTAAHASASSMLPGWNDRVRYLRIN